MFRFRLFRLLSKQNENVIKKMNSDQIKIQILCTVDLFDLLTKPSYENMCQVLSFYFVIRQIHLEHNHSYDANVLSPKFVKNI